MARIEKQTRKRIDLLESPLPNRPNIERRDNMTIILNHSIVPGHDKEVSAQFLGTIFGLRVDPGAGHFVAIRSQ